MADLGVLPGHVVSFARDVNAAAGQVVGTSADVADGSSRAFRWSPLTRTMSAIGGLGDVPSEARAVNDLGFVVGVRGAVQGANHAFVWSPVTRVATDLPGLAGGDSEAHDVNTTLVRIAGTARAANGQFAGRALEHPVAEPPVGFRARTGASSAGP